MSARARIALALALGVVAGISYELLKALPGTVAAWLILASWIPASAALFAYAVWLDRRDRRAGIDVS